MSLLLALWGRGKGWMIAAGALIMAILSFGLHERRQGAKAATTKAEAQRNEEVEEEQRQQAHILEVRTEVQASNAQLPAAPPQHEDGTAKPDTAAGKLFNDWSEPGQN